MNSHSGMKRKGDHIVRDSVLGLMERNDSLSLPGRVLQQVIRRAVQREETPSNARDQPSDRDDKQGSGIHRRVRDTNGVRRPTSKPSAGNAQMGSAESDITDIDHMEQQIERLGKRWRGQLPDIVRATVTHYTVVDGMGLRLFERRVHIRGG